MAALSMDLRERIVASYEEGEGTRQEIADQYRVSLGMVKKLLFQRRHWGDLRPRYQGVGRKAMITVEHRQAMERLLTEQPDMTLQELRIRSGLKCSLQAIHKALVQMGLTYKKRLWKPVSKSDPT